MARALELLHELRGGDTQENVFGSAEGERLYLPQHSRF